MEKSVFLKEVGDTPKNRVWSFLIVHAEYDYSMKDIARYSGIGYTTLKELWKDFREKKIVGETRVVGKAKMYKLNIKNPVVNKFIEYYWAVVDAAVRRAHTLDEGERETLQHSASAMPVSAKNI